MAMLKVWILESFPSQKANHYAAYTAFLFVFVHFLHTLNQLTECYNIAMSYIWKSSQRH